MTDWNWLFEICVKPPTKTHEGEPPKNWRFCPSKDGEPWVSYEIAGHILGLNPRTIERKVQGLPRHPRFAGLVKLTDFETTIEGE